MDGHQQREDGRGHRGVGHEQGHAGDDEKGAQEDEIGILAHDVQHLVGHALGEAGDREGQTHDHRTEDKPDGGVKEVFEGLVGGPDRKDYLEQADGDGGGADGHHLEDPPDRGHEKEAQGHAALGRQGKVLARGVHCVRQIPA